MRRVEGVRRPAFTVELRAAALCLELDCNAVFDGSMGAPCPRCGSVMSHPLAAWLNRVRPSAQPGSSRLVRALASVA